MVYAGSESGLSHCAYAGQVGQGSLPLAGSDELFLLRGGESYGCRQRLFKWTKLQVTAWLWRFERRLWYSHIYWEIKECFTKIGCQPT
ncbi:hypothetical protein CEXT_343871 [Caerostris extrusa]|uniref:Uncharacterized protein n=1 Tax=Caerostris extrusa TaxID=172846 RepID=A0AAV4UV20_CAEEX|nr:hypothetical protein CEXT_343871 [Caerostris extrusa]